MKALVTGCAGFIGSHLVERLLKEGFEVIGIDCFTDYYSREIKERNIESFINHPNFTLIDRDILELDDFPKVDFVFHEAAQAGVRASWGRNFDIYLKDNILTTQKLLEYYKNVEIRKFVYASSSSVYGNTSIPMSENLQVNPVRVSATFSILTCDMRMPTSRIVMNAPTSRIAMNAIDRRSIFFLILFTLGSKNINTFKDQFSKDENDFWG